MRPKLTKKYKCTFFGLKHNTQAKEVDYYKNSKTKQNRTLFSVKTCSFSKDNLQSLLILCLRKPKNDQPEEGFHLTF
jgi:hypothetical protein